MGTPTRWYCQERIYSLTLQCMCYASKKKRFNPSKEWIRNGLGQKSVADRLIRRLSPTYK